VESRGVAQLEPKCATLRLFFCLEARKEMAMITERYAPRHSISIRMPRPIWDWLVVRGDAEGMAPSTYVIKRLEELARLDLRKGEGDGPQEAA
jgi:hypothetical protein